ncbi:hypothetical protein HED50_24285 [Ochrobactrum oryzae]|nr:hypothetical protein [Brucella oryzae]
MASHYENNYGGAVRRLNAIERRFEEVDWSTAPVFDINGLKREELIAANSAILHEIYFDGLGGTGDVGGGLAAALEQDFGSVTEWRAGFLLAPRRKPEALAGLCLPGLERHQRLMIQWAQDHTNCLAGSVPILALDMYEHAYHIDFGSKAGAYVDAFMKNIHWDRVGRRFQHIAERHQDMTPPSETVRGIAPEDLLARFQQQEDILLLDICSPEDAPARAICWLGRSSRCRARPPNGQRTCRAGNRSWPIASMACRQAAMSQQNSTASALMRRCCPAD